MSVNPRIRQPWWPSLLSIGAVLLVAVLLRLRSGPETGGATHADAGGTVVIAEFAASGGAAIPDEDGEPSDWIELWNPGQAAVDLEGCRLTDAFKKMDRWRFPAARLEAGQRLIVFASGKNRRVSGRPLHTNFKLRARGGYLALVSADGQRVLQEFKPGYPALHGTATYGVPSVVGTPSKQTGNASVVGGGLTYAYFERGTPGGPNGVPVDGLVEAVTCDTPGGLRNSGVDVRLSCPTPGAEIRFTTDGSAPAPATGAPYSKPLRIEKTTVLRAAAFKPGFAAPPVTTRTYVFPRQVAAQDGAGASQTWGETNGQPVLASYKIEPDAAGPEAGPWAERLDKALRALPSLSIVAAPSDLYDNATGIYAHPQETGREWERAASAEFIPADGTAGFQIDCGLRIQGGWNRRPEECPKHSMRLLFKRQYGAGHLGFPLFGREGATNFQTLILRGGCNNTWLHWSGEERLRGDYLRDEWMRETSGAMGQPFARGRFVHLYLNGLYWGVYNLTERPSGPFLASKYGGRAEDYDSRNSDKVLTGDANTWRDMFQLANNGITNVAVWHRVEQWLDVTNFADYILLNHYGANADWDAGSNWYAGRSRKPGGRYQFFVWDGERTLESVMDDRTDADDDQSPSRLYHRLEASPEFRAVLAARIKVHCAAGGALSPAVAGARYAALARSVDEAILAEQGRWGAYRESFHQYKTGPYLRYTRDAHWRPEVKRLLETYFPARTQAFLAIMARRGVPVPEELRVAPPAPR